MRKLNLIVVFESDMIEWKKTKKTTKCFLVASIIFYVVSIMNFIDKDTNTGIVFLCLGSSFLCLSSAHQNGNKNNKEP